jgi:riboflavin kinase/FMN adenylyltransferase
MEELWMGPDFALGREREGNVEFLRQAGQEQGFAVRVVPPLTWQGGIISSSRVRSALAAGDLGEVNGCLGRPYRVTGRAISTQPASEAAEHPRVELELPPRRLLPAPGFYAGRASIAAQDLGRAVIDVPAHVPGAPHPVSVRVYLMEDRTPHPGRKMRLSFIARLRNQDEGLNLDAKTFSSAEE